MQESLRHAALVILTDAYEWRWKVSECWTVKGKEGRLSVVYVSSSRSELERRIVATHYNEQSLAEDRTYRDLFRKELAENMKRNDYQIVRCRLVEADSPS